LGYLIASAASTYQPDVMFAGVGVFTALSLLLTFSVQAVESRLTRWRPEAAKAF
jgi:ABC-type nitrate/sulfonate/bicarbonate transport system permease component